MSSWYERLNWFFKGWHFIVTKYSLPPITGPMRPMKPAYSNSWRSSHGSRFNGPGERVCLLVVCPWLLMCFSRKVTTVAQKQMDRLWHTSSVFFHPPMHEYAEKLSALLPEPLKVQYLVLWDDKDGNLWVQGIYLIWALKVCRGKQIATPKST